MTDLLRRPLVTSATLATTAWCRSAARWPSSTRASAPGRRPWPPWAPTRGHTAASARTEQPPALTTRYTKIDTLQYVYTYVRIRYDTCVIMSLDVFIESEEEFNDHAGEIICLEHSISKIVTYMLECTVQFFYAWDRYTVCNCTVL